MEAARAAEGVSSGVAASAVTDEDLAFEREIQRMEVSMPPVMTEGAGENRVTKEQVEIEMLSDLVEDYAPAKNLGELRDQVFHAKQMGCDSIEATPEMIKYFTRGAVYPPEAGYFMFDGVKVWAPDMFEKLKGRDRMSVEALAALKRTEAKP